jgi:excisionase family DNA binding protein
MTAKLGVFNIGEAATFLGAHEQTIRKLARRGAIPAFKVGRDWRFREEALLRWADGQHPCRPSGLVLIVDDDEMVCRALVRVVDGIGCKAQATTDGRKGIEIVSRSKPDLILLDLAMPSMNGSEFLKELRLTEPSLPVVIVTGYPDSELMAEAMKQGPLMLLSKPFETAQVERVVKMVVGERSPINLRPWPEASAP